MSSAVRSRGRGSLAVLSWAAALALLLGWPSYAAAIPYTYTKIIDSGGGFGDFTSFGAPSINKDGTVAFFGAKNDGSRGIFKGDEHGITTIASTTGGVFSGFGTFTAIDDAGTVVFNAQLSTAGPTAITGIFTGNGGAAVTLADTSGAFSAFSPASISPSGTVVAYADLDAGDGGRVVTWTGGSPTTVYFSPTYGFSAVPAINAAGTVAFRSTGGTFGPGVFRGNSETPTLITTLSSAGEPAINAAGVVAFTTLGPGGGVFTGDGSPTLTTIADASDGFSSFGVGPAINTGGEVAFFAYYSATESGIFTGPDSVLDRVVSTGDILDGHAITGLQFFRGLNDDGQVAFLAFGSQAIYRADPLSSGVPEPGTLVLVCFGLIPLAFATRRRTR